MTIAANRLRRTQTGASTSDVFEVTSKVFVKQAASLLLKKLLGALPDVTCALHNRPILSKGVALQQLCTRKLQRKLQICTGMILRPNKAPYAQEHTVLGHVCRKQHGHEHMQSGQLVPDSCQHTDAFFVPFKMQDTAFEKRRSSTSRPAKKYTACLGEDFLLGNKLRRTVKPVCACIE